jgi:outer membrane protein assembly factor BamD (BamD/ComL family)
MAYLRTIVGGALIALAIAACSSAPETIDQDLPPQEYFQQAQEAVERSDYPTALRYYRTFLERYPEDYQNVPAAEYEIAFIYYKQGNYDAAERRFRELLERYQGDQAQLYPEWPRVLSEKILGKIEEKRSE